MLRPNRFHLVRELRDGTEHKQVQLCGPLGEPLPPPRGGHISFGDQRDGSRVPVAAEVAEFGRRALPKDARIGQVVDRHRQRPKELPEPFLLRLHQNLQSPLLG